MGVRGTRFSGGGRWTVGPVGPIREGPLHADHG
jgi:hypothetical protein